MTARVSQLGLFELRARLSERDRRILEHVGLLRLLCAHHVQALLFPAELHASPATAARCCRRVLERLTHDRLLVRLERRVGGARAGSASFVYALTTVGQRVMEDAGPRRRLNEPSAWFVDHTLAIADFWIGLSVHSRSGAWEMLDWQSEPSSWREVVTLGGRLSLRPDLFVVLEIDDYEVRLFIEIDRGTEHMPAINRKCRLYNTYYKSGTEQRRDRVFPRVLWVTPDEQRAERLRISIAGDQRLTPGLFQVTTNDQALTAIGKMP